MRVRFWRASAVVPVLVYLLCATTAAARPDRRDAKPGVSPGASATSIIGTTWSADNTPIPLAHLRLRNVTSGRIEATTIANDAGQFAFSGVEGGSYVVELVDEHDKVRVVGQVFTIAPGETVATFVRLSATVPWFAGFFGTALGAVSTAAAEGITALAPVARPVSANR